MWVYTGRIFEVTEFQVLDLNLGYGPHLAMLYSGEFIDVVDHPDGNDRYAEVIRKGERQEIEDSDFNPLAA